MKYRKKLTFKLNSKFQSEKIVVKDKKMGLKILNTPNVVIITTLENRFEVNTVFKFFSNIFKFKPVLIYSACGPHVSSDVNI